MYKQNCLYILILIAKVLGFSRNTLKSLIQDVVASENITDIDTACNENNNPEDKEEIEALVLSFLYVFVDEANVRDIGAGDIAAEDYFNRDDLHTEMTGLFNDLINATPKYLNTDLIVNI